MMELYGGKNVVFWYLEVNLYVLQASLIYSCGTLVIFLCFN